MVRNPADRGPPIYLLLVDDEPDVCTAWSMLLEFEGMEVATAHNGLQALAMLKSRVPDVVVCDYMMPGMNGIEVCRALQSDDAMREAAIILWTAARNIDANGWVDLVVEKPVHVDAFLRDIHLSLAKRRDRST